jgi:hypothetical protein
MTWPRLLEDEHTPVTRDGFLLTLRAEWEGWRTHAKYHPNRVLWWDRYVKRVIGLTF